MTVRICLRDNGAGAFPLEFIYLELGVRCGAPPEARYFSISAAGIAPATRRPLVKNRVGVLLT